MIGTNITGATDKARAARDQDLQDRHPEYAAARSKADKAEEAYMTAPPEERNQRATEWMRAEREANEMEGRLLMGD